MSFEEKKTHTSPLCKDSWQTGSNVNFLGEVIYMQNAMNVNKCPPLNITKTDGSASFQAPKNDV